MNAYDFVDEIIDDIKDQKLSFVLNFPNQEQPYWKWVRQFIAWMEWDTDDDCIRCYGNYGEDK